MADQRFTAAFHAAAGDAPLHTHEGESGEQVKRLRSPEPSAVQRFEKRQLMGLLRTHFRKFKRERLGEREKAILEGRLLASQPETLQVLGERFGVSRERIRQVELRIIEKLRNYLFNKIPDIRCWRLHRIRSKDAPFWTLLIFW